ncbi:hypothetical protein FB565_001505 [Actinoplanes lutulentus]|uniref:hypothetical protein n=1 Tax=Actinoplanes lutulentus TaxID=1287878 RepID=UPI0016062D61|nr:hypothetical protein [Actinoplanes lutulentus]MBB2941801.1 hypothetical protein [Actinoplanes lutulentus]
MTAALLLAAALLPAAGRTAGFAAGTLAVTVLPRPGAAATVLAPATVDPFLAAAPLDTAATALPVFDGAAARAAGAERAGVALPAGVAPLRAGAADTAGLIVAFLAAGIEVFLLANDCGHVGAWRRHDSG